jgi:hypothetical protein
MSFLDNLFTTGIATALKTPTGSIDVQTSAPVLNRVLKVTNVSPPRATWEAESGGSNADTTVLVPGDTLSPEVDHAYYCLSACTVTLPNATIAGNVGKRLAVTFSQKRNLVRGESLESPNSLIDALGQPVGELPNLPAGTYVFEAMLDTGVTPTGFWVMHQLAPVDVGVIDVDYCYPEELPIYSVTSVGTGTRYQLEGTGDSPDKLKFDGQGNYAAGQTLIVPFDVGDVQRVAVFKVINNDAPDDWQLESLYVFPGVSELPNDTELEYHVRFGEQWGGRRFRTNAKGNAFLPQYYVLQRAPLECWPPDGSLLTGTGSGSFGHLDDKILAGKNNLLNVSGSHTLKLVCPSTSYAKGERFAVTGCSGGGPWTIDVSDTDAVGISDVAGAVGGTSVLVTFAEGTYVEWQLCADETWRVVSYIQGTTPG